MCLRVSLPSGHNGVSSVVWTKATKQTTARDASSAHGVPGEAVLRHSVWSVRARAVNLVHRVDRVVVVGPLFVWLFRWLVGWLVGLFANGRTTLFVCLFILLLIGGVLILYSCAPCPIAASCQRCAKNRHNCPRTGRRAHANRAAPLLERCASTHTRACMCERRPLHPNL